MKCLNIRWNEECGRCATCMTKAHWRRVEDKLDAIAKAIEAQRAETVKHGSVEDESAVPKGFAQ